jgi:hypothetical protein
MFLRSQDSQDNKEPHLDLTWYELTSLDRFLALAEYVCFNASWL